MWFLNDSIIPTVRPIVRVIRIMFLNLLGKNSILSGFNIHRSVEPSRIASGLIISNGILEYIEVWLFESGLDLIRFLFDIFSIRNEYEAVIPIDEIIINVSKHSNFEFTIFSIIMSFEKYPEVKGNPIRAALVMPNVVVVKDILLLFFPIIRMSW